MTDYSNPTVLAAALKRNDPNALVYMTQALGGSNPIAASQAALGGALSTQTPSNDITVSIYDNFYNLINVVGDYKSLKYTFNANEVGTGTLVLKQTDPLVPYVMNCWQAVVPITIQTGYLRWSGRVEYVDYEFKGGENGSASEYNVTCYLTDDYQWFDKMLCWPDFLLPIQVQFPSEALFIGPAITCIKTLIAEQAFRLQSGLWELVNNALSGDENWEAWFGTLLESNGNLLEMLMTPIVVVPTDPLFDTSPWTSISGRMDKISTLVKQIVDDNGLLLSANLWLPGEPQPAGMVIPLTSPTIVVDCKNFSGVTGPTGTFIDGLVEDVVDLQNSALGNALNPLLNPSNEYAPEGVNIAPSLGVNFTKTWVVFTDQPRGGLREFHLIPHSPLAYTVIGGGKSPQWVNDLINATLEYLIDAIEIAVGFTGIPDTILDGTFDDVILAFQLLENQPRRQLLGPYGFPEYFAQTGASAYTLDEWFALQNAMWDTRGYNGIIVSFDNGYPYTIGKDLFIGGLASFAVTIPQAVGSGAESGAFGFGLGTGQTYSNLYTDYLRRVTITDDRTNRVRAECVIGDGKSHEDPVVKIQRTVAHFEEFFQAVTLSNN